MTDTVVETNPLEAWSVQFPLSGPSGEPVDLERNVPLARSGLPAPHAPRRNANVLEVTLPVYGSLRAPFWSRRAAGARHRERGRAAAGA
jgi:hypothetical protein